MVSICGVWPNFECYAIELKSNRQQWRQRWQQRPVWIQLTCVCIDHNKHRHDRVKAAITSDRHLGYITNFLVGVCVMSAASAYSIHVPLHICTSVYEYINWRGESQAHPCHTLGGIRILCYILRNIYIYICSFSFTLLRANLILLCA